MAGDPALGIAILPSKYVRGPGSIVWHAQVADRLGFQRVAIPISPPEFVGHTGIEEAGKTLDTLIQYPEFESVFANPHLKAIHVTCDVGGSQANGWNFPNDKFTDQQLQQTYSEYLAFARQILKKYGKLGKEITIGGPNEVELLLKGGWDPSTEDSDVSPSAMENGIRYYNVFYRAIRDANAEYPDSTPLLTGLEVLQIRSKFGNPKAVTGLDLAAKLDVPPDELTLSAWQFAARDKDGFLFKEAMEIMKQFDPKSQIAVTEYGIRENNTDLSRTDIAGKYGRDLKIIKGNGGKYSIVWGLTDFNSAIINPDNKDTDGLGLIRPDGSIQKEVYNALRNLSSVPTVR